MIFNYKNINDYTVEANYGYFIEITLNDKNIKIILNFNNNKYDFNNMNINEKIDLFKYLHSDASLIIDGISYIFDLADNKVLLTKIDDNKFKLEINIDKSDVMITYPREVKNIEFDSVKIDTEISFNYNYKPEIDNELIDKKIEDHHFTLTDILNKLDK